MNRPHDYEPAIRLHSVDVMRSLNEELDPLLRIQVGNHANNLGIGRNPGVKASSLTPLFGMDESCCIDGRVIDDYRNVRQPTPEVWFDQCFPVKHERI
jgi:hypothetical protein